MSREVVLAKEAPEDDFILENDTNTVNDTKAQEISEPRKDYESPNSDSFIDEEEDDEHEDVAPDFFDDFSNQDFMAGLDVVDAWDDEEVSANKGKTKKPDESRNKKSRPKRRRSRSPKSNRNDSNRRSRRSRDKPRNSKDKDRSHRSKDHKSKDKEPEVDERRDPEKTKRDIQKDKVKYLKNKEAKIISEKLKVVETGLVPPGTEMEVDLKQIKTTLAEKEQEQRKLSAQKEKPIHEKRHKSKSAEVLRNRHGKRISPSHRVSRSPERNYERRFPLRRSRSPYRGRSRSRSPYRRRISAERRLYPTERRNHRYRDSSPTILRRKDRTDDLSPISNVSEREMWLRQREYKRDRKNSCSPNNELDSINRKRSNDFLEELANKLNFDKKKKYFLKEIQERINEPSDRSYHRAMMPGPVPAPGRIPIMHGPPIPGCISGPSSHQFFPQSLDPAPQYDQQFFIGQPDVFHNPNQYAPQFMGAAPVSNVMPGAPGDTGVVSQPLSSPIINPIFPGVTNNVDILKNQKNTEDQRDKDKEAIAKLFEDKKISLSDFLSVSAKNADSTRPVNVQKKVKVISLCQDALKALGVDSNLGGRFFLKKTPVHEEKKEDIKNQSPLRKIPVIRFGFTTPAKVGSEDKSSVQSTLNKLLASLGVPEIDTLPQPPPSPVISEVVVKTVPPKRPVSPAKRPVTPAKPSARKYDPMLGAKFQMKMCQTDPVKCTACDIRKARKFVDQGTQCVPFNSFDVGTQISEEDMQRMGIKPHVKDALRNQSFALLTPAQILAAQMSSPDQTGKQDLFPAANRMTPPPPEISPEKQNIRSSLSNNDSFSNRSEYADRFNPDSFGNQNHTNRSGGFKLPSIFDKIVTNNMFDNANRPRNMFDTSPNKSNFERSNVNDGRFRGNQGFNQRMSEENLDFEPLPQANLGNNPNQRPFVRKNRGNFKPGPYGGRKFL